MGPLRPGFQSLYHQMTGLIVGAVVGVVLLAVFPDLQRLVQWQSWVFWFAIIGSVIASLDSFERAGRVITRRESRAINLIVGLGIPVTFFIVLSLLLKLI